jgi:acetyl-CoA carboxylase biotin carboxyl carrier protein
MDEKTILHIIDKFAATNIAELELHEGNLNLVLRKIRSSAPVLPPPSPPVPSTPSPAAASPAPSAADPAAGEAVASPIVGTFYSAPSPDAPPFVSVGSKVKAGDTLCILEAMKMMNNLEAEFDCEILAIHATSQEFIEYGQKLFTVKRI